MKINWKNFLIMLGVMLLVGLVWGWICIWTDMPLWAMVCTSSAIGMVLGWNWGNLTGLDVIE